MRSATAGSITGISLEYGTNCFFDSSVPLTCRRMESAVDCVGRLCQLDSQRIAFFEVSVSFVAAYEGNVRSSFNLDLTVNDYGGHHPYAIVSCDSKLSDKL